MLIKKLFIIFLILIPIYSGAKERGVPFKLYKDNYIIGNHQDIKGQVSIKYFLWYPFKYSPCFGYTQSFLWNIYDLSSPFKNYDHMPELFYNHKFNDYISAQSGIEHKSNGKDGYVSRSINFAYSEFLLTFGTQYVLGINIKAMQYFGLSQFTDTVPEYNGYFNGKIYFLLKNSGLYLDQEQLYVKGGGYKKYWVEAGLKFRIITSHIQPMFFLQYYYGYMESLLEFDKKQHAIRFGFIFQ